MFFRHVFASSIYQPWISSSHQDNVWQPLPSLKVMLLIYVMWESETRDGGRCREKLHVFICFFCFDLSCYYPLLPGVNYAAVMAPRETRRQAEGGPCWMRAVTSPQVFTVTAHNMAYVSSRQQRREGGRTQKTTSEKEGEEKKMSVRQWEKVKETEKDGEICHHKESDSFLLFWI